MSDILAYFMELCESKSELPILFSEFLFFSFLLLLLPPTDADSFPLRRFLSGYKKATLFDAGGQVAITEFSWNPTDMYGNSSKEICLEYYNVPKCWGQRIATGVDPKYWIPQ